MHPQNGHQLRQQSILSNFPAPHQQFDASSQAAFFNNMDPTQAAKQMAALNAMGHARLATGSRAPQSSSGTNSASYLGAMNHGTFPSGNPDLLNGTLNNPANFQNPSHHAMVSASNAVVNASFLDPAMPQSSTAPTPAQAAIQMKQRQQVFLTGLASIMAKRNTPLPPTLTGVSIPHYDHTNSPWKLIEPSSETGSFRLAGKDINLFRLWNLVQHNGGGQAISSKNGWGLIAAQFELPEEFPRPQANGSTSVANMLSQYYMAILFPFEEIYKRNIPEHQRRMQMAPRMQGASFQNQASPGAAMQGRPMQGVPGITQQSIAGQMQRQSGNPGVGVHVPPNPTAQPSQPGHTPVIPTQRPSSANFNPQPGLPASNIISVAPADGIPPPDTASDLGENLLDQDAQGIKRKMEFEEGNNKRARQKTESLEGNSVPSTKAVPASAGVSTEPSQKPASISLTQSGQPMRRKTEYVPLTREADTHGGRDLKAIEAEFANAAVRPLRDINDWGIVDIEALTMSLRSRLGSELSYALTTLTLLSTMRGPTQGTGFPIMQCPDLFEEILDLLEETAFGAIQDPLPTLSEDDAPLVTNRELMNRIIDAESRPFATAKRSELGPHQPPANVILVISNLLRNFSLIFDNAKYICQHDRALPILLKLCSAIQQEREPKPASSAMSLGDLVALRKDVLYTIINIAPFIDLIHISRSSTMQIAAKQAFNLAASYLVDPSEAVSPYAIVQLTGSLKPPSLADTALEVFTRMSQIDSNRQVISQAVSQASIRRLFESLVYRLPVVDADFQLVVREVWMAYVEKIVMSIYSLAFLAPPTLKRALKTDRKLGFKGVMLRMIRKFLLYPDHKNLMVATRRAVEAMKILDDEEDTFDTGPTTAPTLAFGMGYGEAGESGAERGTGLLGGHREMAWEMLMHREVLNDAVMFGELESLARVE